MTIEFGGFDGASAGDRSEPFLGVERSATGKIWIGPSIVSERSAVMLEQNTQLPGILCRSTGQPQRIPARRQRIS